MSLNSFSHYVKRNLVFFLQITEKVIFEGGHPWEHHPRCLRCLMEVGLRRDSPGMFHMQTQTKTKTKTKTKTNKTTKNSILTEFQSISLFFVKVWQNCADVNILPKAMWLSLYLHYHGSIIVHIEGKKNRFDENLKQLPKLFFDKPLVPRFPCVRYSMTLKQKIASLRKKTVGRSSAKSKNIFLLRSLESTKNCFWMFWICTQ